MKSIFALGVASMLMTATPVHAQWASTVDGPDVFGVTKAMAMGVTDDGRYGLVVRCTDGDAIPVVALIERGDPLPQYAVDAMLVSYMVIKTKALAAPIRVDGFLGGWNDVFNSAMRADGSLDEHAALFEALSNATGAIQIGVALVADEKNKVSFTISSRGSSKALADVKRVCMEVK